MLALEYKRIYAAAAKEAQRQARDPNTGLFGSIPPDREEWNSLDREAAALAAKVTGAYRSGNFL
jgi:hypothetical protein